MAASMPAFAGAAGTGALTRRGIGAPTSRLSRASDGARVAARPHRRVVCTATDGVDEEELKRREHAAEVDRMRSRLEGLFGSGGARSAADDDGTFDGRKLRSLIKERWGVQYDVQPQKRHGRVYVQVMWRYFEQQSFYLGEDEFASHCEAVAELLNQWNAIEFFKDYVMSTKKRPVVGITINIPIPGIDAAKASF